MGLLSAGLGIVGAKSEAGLAIVGDEAGTGSGAVLGGETGVDLGVVLGGVAGAGSDTIGVDSGAGDGEVTTGFGTDGRGGGSRFLTAGV